MSSSSELVTLCQSCLERGLEPREAVGLYQKLPICDECLGAIMDNKSDAPDTDTKLDELETRKELALNLLEQFEALCEQWPLKADESLLSHNDFYNHKPPAIVNTSLEELQEIYSRRKGILFAIRHKDERWYTEIERLKRAAREEANLTGIAKSSKVYSRVPKSGVADDVKQKLAKKLGISVAQLDAMGKQSREQEFTKITGSSPSSPAPLNPQPSGSTKGILSQLQKTVKAAQSPIKAKINPITGKPY